jgi:hypothetical protein
MTSERHQMLEGLDSRNFAAPIRQVLADIAAHAIGAPIERVLTQPGSEAEIQTEAVRAIIVTLAPRPARRPRGS